jgi:hypothetical protein
MYHLIRKDLIMEKYKNITIRKHDEEHREERLKRLVDYIEVLSEFLNEENLMFKIKSLHDHKGNLTVNCDFLSSKEKMIVTAGWTSSFCCEDERNIEFDYSIHLF